MAVRRPDDAWYTALYRDPHTLWWAPGAILFLFVFALTRFMSDDTTPVAILWAAVFAISATAGVCWRRRRRG